MTEQPEPFARFWCCDLQCHSPLEPEFSPGVAAKDRKARESAAERYVSTAVGAGLEVIALTDHNSAAFLPDLLKAAEGRLAVFPGVEISAADGYHLLVLFEIGTTASRVAEFLAKLGITAGNERGPQGEPVCAENRWSWGSVLQEVAGRTDAIAIAPHVRSGKGILKKSIAGEVKARNWAHPDLYAVEDNRAVLEGQSMTDRIMLNELDEYRRERVPARVWGSDCKAYEEIAREHTYIKMSEPSIEGLRQAFLDPGSRIRHPDHYEPASRDRIVSLAWQAGFLSERKVGFSEQLNCLIGGKGTGKSTVIESVRFALEQDHEDPTLGSQYGALVENALPPGSKVTLEVCRRDGTHYTVTRTHPYESEVLSVAGEILDILPRDALAPTVLSQGEILSIARQPTSHLSLLDSFLDAELGPLRSKEDQLLRHLQQNRVRLVETSEERDSIAEDRVEILRLQEAKRTFDERGLSARTEQRRALDREEKLVKEAIEAAEAAEEELAALNEEERLPALLLDDDLPHQNIWKPFRVRWEKASGVIHELRAKGVDLFRKLEDDLRDATGTESEWAGSIARQREEVSAIYRDLQEEYPDLDLAQFDRLDRELEELQTRVKGATGIEEKLTGQVEERRARLRELRDNREAQFRLRHDLAERLNSLLPGSVQIEVKFLGERESALKSLLDLRTNVRKEALRRIVEHEDFTPERLGQSLREGVEDLVGQFGVTESQAASLVAKTKLTNRLEIEELRVPERVVISFNTSRRGESPRYRNLLNVSVGQKATCILLILLAQSGPPLIVDQPEDDLDNRFIYDDIVERLREVKDRRQLILSTHNANIPVLGDAELIVVMDTEERSGRIGGTIAGRGSIDSPAVRRSVTQILEGGSDAFRRRREKYGVAGPEVDSG